MFFFFNDTATTEIYTLSLHDALPISNALARRAPRSHPQLRDAGGFRAQIGARGTNRPGRLSDRKSTRLNSSHLVISYAVFCLKKKNEQFPIALSSTKVRSNATNRTCR